MNLMHRHILFAVAVLALAGGLAWWAWYELIRSPYLTHGFMTLDLQFRLPPGMVLPPSSVALGGPPINRAATPPWPPSP